MDRLIGIRSMIRELWNGGLWAVTQVALMPFTRSVRLRLQADDLTQVKAADRGLRLQCFATQ